METSKVSYFQATIYAKGTGFFEWFLIQKVSELHNPGTPRWEGTSKILPKTNEWAHFNIFISDTRGVKLRQKTQKNLRCYSKHTHIHTQRHIYTHRDTYTQTHLHTQRQTHRHIHTGTHQHRHRHTHNHTNTTKLDLILKFGADKNSTFYFFHTHTETHLHPW